MLKSKKAAKDLSGKFSSDSSISGKDVDSDNSDDEDTKGGFFLTRLVKDKGTMNLNHQEGLGKWLHPKNQNGPLKGSYTSKNINTLPIISLKR